jgi:putative sterol carrier protein
VAKKVLSPEWMEDYARLWNATPVTREGLAELSMLIEFRLAEDANRVAQIDVVEGEVRASGAPLADRTPDYVLTARVDDWRRLGTGELATAKAMVTRKVKFQGRLAEALAHLSSLDAAMKFFGQIDTDWSV